ncbi:hypothetical protein [Glycomyces harbinensis]|uniref:Lipoprotein n=1 Tax=Glycomyces harbinensis TaxID=58114 RepID=A0A1G6WH86_9ACTN|nr:hypothetical protein [Glycomyces harbinensis]SDD65158.1 hypothetical protein SAMN05216270_10638 [Glycomyces harbinensis]
MTSRTAQRLAGAIAAPALGLALVACGDGGNDTSGGSGDADNQAAAQLSPQEAVLASVEGLNDSSYKMESTMTVNGLDYLVSSGTYAGENSQASADILMSALMEASGEQLTPEEAEMMGSMFGDMHTETVVIDKVLYMQMSGGMFDAMAEDFGENAWFTMDLTEDAALSDIYSQYGGMDLGEQTELILTDLTDVEETADGTFTGTLDADSEAMTALSGASGAEASALVDGTEVTVTLDGDGLLQTMVMSLPEYQGMTMEMTSEIVEIGGDYTITAPDTDNLHDFEEFGAALGGGM